MGRKKFYEGVDEMQSDLDEYLLYYNTKRPHQGRNMNGMTPEQAFKKAVIKGPTEDNPKEVNEAA